MKILTLALVPALVLLFSAGAGAESFNNVPLAVGEADSYTFEAQPGDHDLTGWAVWDTYYAPDKDIAVTVTTPSNLSLVYDDTFNAKQTFFFFGDMEPGTWTITATNVGSVNVLYDLEFAPVTEPVVSAAQNAKKQHGKPNR